MHYYDKLTEADHKQHPSGRVGIPRDIVNAALFFLPIRKIAFVNAVNLVVDGGMTKRMFYVE
ncbi:MAG: SDR family oxidoreductase [Marinifilaceae bacterium]